uniref:hypothetical protein n=1 Tax=Pedobacter schmidteae TaxID=2201271 RepID=UPI0013CEFA9F|nr:hypothetical protein [Pedobacter schmidteae]
MKKKHLHIHRILSVLLLWVFAIALTPFSAFHHHDHHEVKCTSHDKACTHKLHVGTQTEHCLVCEAHFEKNYTTAHHHFLVYRVSKPVAKFYAEVSSSYTRLINLSLRGPPVA